MAAVILAALLLAVIAVVAFLQVSKDTAVDSDDGAHALRAKGTDFIVETKKTASFSSLLDLPLQTTVLLGN